MLSSALNLCNLRTKIFGGYNVHGFTHQRINASHVPYNVRVVGHPLHKFQQSAPHQSIEFIEFAEFIERRMIYPQMTQIAQKEPQDFLV